VRRLAAVVEVLQIAELEAGRELCRTWIHCDMDCFFAACEEQANPSLVRKEALSQ
jgi:hypothetical protein